MTLSVDFPPQVSARLADFARQQGIDQKTAVEKIVMEHLPPIQTKLTAENDQTIALLESWLREDATDDPAELEAAAQELDEFKRNMNQPRKEAGARLLYPEVK